jgi:hypothetical protein
MKAARADPLAAYFHTGERRARALPHQTNALSTSVHCRQLTRNTGRQRVLYLPLCSPDSAGSLLHKRHELNGLRTVKNHSHNAIVHDIAAA